MAKKMKLSPSAIEKLYDSGDYRLTQERNDFLLPQVLDFVREKEWLNLRPEYQRRLVWDRARKSLFIESLLMNVPVPPVFLYETELNRYEVMDGQQRLNAIVEFYENRFSLHGLEKWNALNGLTYSKFPPRIRSGLDRRRISANVLVAENASSKRQINTIRRIVFERLNTGGIKLRPHELRNSLYSGSFNELLIELAGSDLFDDICEIPRYSDNYRPNEGYISQALADNTMFKRMDDCEVVLRFFAFRHQSAIKGSVRSILDDCMQNYQGIAATEIPKLRNSFNVALATAYEIFGTHAFHIRDGDGKWNLSYPLFDAVMVALDILAPNRKALLRNRTKIKAAVANALKNERIYEIIVAKPNTAKAVRQRLAIILRILKRFA